VSDDIPAGMEPWAGGKCPVPFDVIVAVQYRAKAEPTKGVRIEWPVPAGRLDWTHDGEDDDIVAYAVIDSPA
jgi:hypothetical protein